MSKSKRKGHYYRGDKRIDITWGDKISEGVKAANKEREFKRPCNRCGKIYTTCRETSKWCSQRCASQGNYNDVGGLKRKAKTLGANLLMGRGKQEKLMRLISESFVDPCKYCGEWLTLDTVSVDHKIAYGKDLDRYEKRSEENREVRRHMDRLENLQIICRSCNSNKGDFDDDEYEALLGLDEQFPGIRGKLLRRLAHSRVMWRQKGKN